MTMTGEELRTARKARGETQTQFGEFCGRAKRTVRAWENNELPVPGWVERLIRADQIIKKKRKAKK